MNLWPTLLSLPLISGGLCSTLFRLASASCSGCRVSLQRALDVDRLPGRLDVLESKDKGLQQQRLRNRCPVKAASMSQTHIYCLHTVCGLICMLYAICREVEKYGERRCSNFVLNLRTELLKKLAFTRDMFSLHSVCTFFLLQNLFQSTGSGISLHQIPKAMKNIHMYLTRAVQEKTFNRSNMLDKEQSNRRKTVHTKCCVSTEII